MDGGFARCITGWIKLRRWLKSRLAKQWSRNCSRCRENADLCVAFPWRQRLSHDSLDCAHPISLRSHADRSFGRGYVERKRIGHSALRKEFRSCWF